MTSKKRAFSSEYTSVNQLSISGFETPFRADLDPSNRWVRLSQIIPWDEVVSIYNKAMKKGQGRPALNGRVVVGVLIIQQIENHSDRHVIQIVQENLYMQYFLGYQGFSTVPPFDHSLLVEIRKRLGEGGIQAINEVVLQHNKVITKKKSDDHDKKKGPPSSPHGKVMIDATVFPQDISYPTDLNLLDDARLITEQVIDVLHKQGDKKPRTYRKRAHKEYLYYAKKRRLRRNKLRTAIGKQLRYLRRNLKSIDTLIAQHYSSGLPIDMMGRVLYKKLLVVSTLFQQQWEMWEKKVQRVDHRIVSISQPHVRPIKRGKAHADTEFGAKVNISLVDGFTYVERLSWDAFNEGGDLPDCIESFRQRYGHYPAEVLADQIYATRANRKFLKQLGIKLMARPLGRPPNGKKLPGFSAGDRNPVEGKFGQLKRIYGLDRIPEKLEVTSRTTIYTAILVTNLLKLLRGGAPLWLWLKATFSAVAALIFAQNQQEYSNRLGLETLTVSKP